MKKILYLLSHPIQYQSPLIKSISSTKNIKLKVLYESHFSLKKYYDKEFNKIIKFDVDLIKGYESNFITKKKKINIFQYFIAVKKIINQFKPDFIWIHGYETLRKIVIIILCKSLNIKVLVRGESNLIDQGRLYLFSRFFFFNLIDFFVHKYMAIGKKNYDFYRKFVKKDKISFFPYVVDNSYFQRKVSTSKINDLKNKFKIKKNSLVFLYSGKIISKKNVKILLKSFVELKIKNSFLFIVGDGIELNKLKNEFNQKNIIFTGFVNQSQLIIYYNLSKIFVLPSKYEPWGLSVNEAMNCNNALLLSSNVGCGADLLKKNKNGLIFRFNQKKDLKLKMLNFVRNRRKLFKMRKFSKKIINNWDIDYAKKCFLETIN
jgi:glycosyltransferase involved in cell wall biosynthesis